MKEQQPKMEAVEWCIFICSFVALVVLIIVFNKPPLYDEPYYLENVPLLNHYGLSKAYLMHHKGSAGPLYPVLHYVLEPLTKLRVPHVRLVNVCLLLGSIFCIGKTLRALGLEPSYALFVLAVPMTFTISGLALTEIPAIFFFSAGIYLIIRGVNTSSISASTIINLIVGGLFLSFAIVGRQPYLLTLAALPVIFWQKQNWTKSLLLLLLTLFFSLALPAYVFYQWGGLVAPEDALFYKELADQGVAFTPVYSLICLAYFAIIFIIIAPGVFMLPSKREAVILVVAFVSLFVINFRFGLIQYLPLKAVFHRIAPTLTTQLASLFGAFLMLFALFFLLSLCKQLQGKKYSKELVFFSLSALLIAMSCVKITWGFSSRYAAQAIPMLIPIGAYFYGTNSLRIWRIAAGIILGLLSFASYIIW